MDSDVIATCLELSATCANLAWQSCFFLLQKHSPPQRQPLSIFPQKYIEVSYRISELLGIHLIVDLKSAASKGDIAQDID